MVGYAGRCGDRRRAPRGASKDITNILFFFNLGANYIGYSVVENPSAAHLISQFCVDIFYISIKLNNGPKLASQ